MDQEELLSILECVESEEIYESASDAEVEIELESAAHLATPGINQEETENAPELGINTQFQWSAQQQPLEKPLFDNFYSGISPSLNLTSSSSELDVFLKFVDEEFMKKIVQYTNRYHRYFVLNTDIRNHSRLQRWEDVSISEMYVFLATIMLMTRNSRLTIEEHWSTNALLNSPIFTTLMSRNRFTTILGMLHFSEPGPRQVNDPILIKISEVIKDTRNKFQNNFIPYQKLCIDESMVPFKGRLIIKQYMPNKRHRFGIKLFVLCDVLTKIILDFIVYTGTETEIIRSADLGVTGSVVATILQKYFNSNRIIYMDNWYSSPILFDFLKSHGTGACGTVKKNRKGMPTLKKLKKGERDAKFSSNMMAMKWHDKRDVYMLSTIHEDVMSPTEKMDRSTGLPIMKPECIIDYNKHMGIVDSNDMMLSTIHCTRKIVKWYKKLFFHIIDMHLLNAFYYFKILRDDPKLSFAKFQLAVITQIVLKYRGDSVMPLTSRNIDNPNRLLGGNAAQHMPAILPDTKKLRCKVCSHLHRKRSETRYWCQVCKVPLCVLCFRNYHEKRDLKA